ncbi:thiosulfate dehydrogenase [quinone] large subunit [Salinibacillus kushneri]|uniref:Thiosulfate dehydrogenase [quinone] large subunit n=1 Tax=Salinibacillus kushneri TaxID=237682 RepID=A0A1I0AIP0_9BACI|nr:DoxX family protein [Salinibacillus kushneri]SES94047.1 thiosulfate dehydrogenase [quinone] large subunit [Salinibacillus kushneri]
MFNHILRHNKYVAGVLAFLRIYIGYQWITSGFGKLTGGGFDASGFIQGAIASASGDHPAVQGWWAAFLESFALPNAELFSFLVMWGECLVGLSLILGIFTNFAGLMGMTMNFAFLFSGTVSTNAQMVLLTLFIVVAGYNAGRFGLDRWVMPFLNKHNLTFKSRKKQKDEVAVA